MDSERPSGEFKGLKERVASIERRFNPEGFNLHFGIKESSKVWPGFWEEVELLALEGLETVRKHHDYFISSYKYSRMYDDDMCWYDLFLLVHGAGIAHAVREDPAVHVSLETRKSILSCLLAMTEYTVVVPADICKRNYEALAAFLFAFPDMVPEAQSFSHGLPDGLRRGIIEDAAAYAVHRRKSER